MKHPLVHPVAAVHESGFGTTRTCSDVRRCAAFRDIPDIERA
jgi:hypothetical protein